MRRGRRSDNLRRTRRAEYVEYWSHVRHSSDLLRRHYFLWIRHEQISLSYGSGRCSTLCVEKKAPFASRLPDSSIISREMNTNKHTQHNITQQELSERPSSQSLNGIIQDESNASPPPPRPWRIGRYHCRRLPTTDSNPSGTDGAFEVHAAVGRQLVLI